jgi:TPR repeat protein
VRRSISTVVCLGLLLAARTALAEDFNQAHLTGVMNSVFGAGNWRQTGGYRTPAREDQLRAEGAMTVPPGVLSRHSLGRPGAPGAYDLVVDGLTPSEAAARLRASGTPFRRLLPEGAHGSQGAHLHLEPLIPGLPSGAPRAAAPEWLVAAPTPAEQAVTRLRQAAVMGEVGAQLALADAYENGHAVPKDLVAAYVWAAAASESERADQGERKLASARLVALAGKMRPEDMRRARQFAGARDLDRCGSPASQDAPVIVLGVENTAAGEPPDDSCRRN